jgi:hypothetical protein
MSRENVEAFRRGTDALERGRVDAALLEELIDRDVVFEPLRASVFGVYRGHEGFRQCRARTCRLCDGSTRRSPGVTP